MKPDNCCNSACRHCRFYNPEGRRGGMCSQLGVLVQAEWKSCNFATPAFETEWQTLPEIVLLEKSFSLGCATPKTNLEVEAVAMAHHESQVLSEVVVSQSVK
ncbi:hypothetical protein ACN4EE_04505 [Geminocystis sp. CENA526]|uniref:hypothetical protein n=1 Tax=Geminocystis sp. CENA526 TaxID=1355871 RepID=UPI003D6DBD4F